MFLEIALIQFVTKTNLKVKIKMNLKLNTNFGVPKYFMNFNDLCQRTKYSFCIKIQFETMKVKRF